MADFILKHGDKAIFLPNFGAAIVVVKPGQLKGSGPGTLGGAKLCVDGDEASVEVPGCMYMSSSHPIPGSGTLKIKQLAGDQLAKKTNTGGAAVLLKGGQFEAEFQVQSPAKKPPPPPGTAPPEPDTTSSYSGKGMFQTTNTKFKGA